MLSALTDTLFLSVRSKRDNWFRIPNNLFINLLFFIEFILNNFIYYSLFHFFISPYKQKL